MQVLAGPDPEIRLAQPLWRAMLTIRGDLGRIPHMIHLPNSAAPAPARKGRCSCWPATVRSPTSQSRPQLPETKVPTHVSFVLQTGLDNPAAIDVIYIPNVAVAQVMQSNVQSL